jgi:hypothetical protein
VVGFCNPQIAHCQVYLLAQLSGIQVLNAPGGVRVRGGQ